MATSNPLLPPVEHRRAGSVDIVLGVQWGDEGKGRVVDLLARDYAIVARFGGGDNAGHSIQVGEQKLALRIVPSGALVPSDQAAHRRPAPSSSLRDADPTNSTRSPRSASTSRASTISDRAQIVLPVSCAARPSVRARPRWRGDRDDRARHRSGLRRPRRPARRDVRRSALGRSAGREDPAGRCEAKAPLLAGIADVPREEDVVAETLAAAERVAAAHCRRRGLHQRSTRARARTSSPRAPRVRCLTLRMVRIRS